LSEEEPILDEAMGLVEQRNCVELSYRLSAALAMTEAAFVEARRRVEQDKGWRQS
jgi:hypothetical protein